MSWFASPVAPGRSYSLRLLVPFIVIAFGVVTAAVTYWLTTSQARRQIEAFADKQLVQAGNLYGHDIQAALRNADFTAAQAKLLRAAVDDSVRYAALLDDQDRVRYSTIFAERGRSAASVGHEELAALFTAARQQLRPQRRLLFEQGLMQLVVPLYLEPTAQALVPTRLGLLVMIYDFRSWQRLLHQHALFNSAVIAALMALLCGMIALVIHLGVTRRMAALAALTQQIGVEQYSDWVVDTRFDEIGQVSRALTAMALRLNDAMAGLRASERRVRAIMESASDAVFVLTLQGQILFANRQAELLFQYPRQRLLESTIDQLMALADSPSLLATIAQRLGSSHRILGADQHYLMGRRRDGAVIPLEMTVGSIDGDDNDCCARVVAIVRDISDRRALERQLLYAQRMEAVGRLTAGIAHDFNNLLAVIQGNAELLQAPQALAPEEHLGCLEDIQASAQRGATLTRQLLAFGRRSPLHPTVVDLNAVIAEMDRLLRRTLPETIELEVVLGGGLWPVAIDRALLESALLNLAINARDAMPKGGKLTLETANVRLSDEYVLTRGEDVAPGRYVMVAVTDTGSGMSTSVLENAFEPFFTTKPIGEGSGMGLAMVYGFVKQSGGIIRLYSEVGEGTTVKLYFPLALHEADPMAAVQAPTELAGGDERLLLVEDDERVRRTLVRQLKGLGYRVVEAANGVEALRLIASHEVDLVLTDIVMPGPLQGPQLAQQIRAKFPATPIIFMSGYPLEAAIHGNGLRPNDIQLMKPVQLSELAAALRRVLQRPA